MNRVRGFAAIAALLALGLAGCARKPASIPVAERPAPPPKPAPDRAPRTPAIHADLSQAEAAWHLRAALNVAALSCDRAGKLGIAASYNQLLARHRAPLAAAYKAEGARFTGTGALDSHMTKLYNYFAQPGGQARFCAAAAGIAAETKTIAPERFAAFAPAALDRLVQPFETPHDAPPPLRMAAATAGPPWRIQLGAYSGDTAAKAAWSRIRSRMTSAAAYTPHYEDVPTRRLVRIRIGPVSDQRQAIELCAAAAGAGLDCLPVPPTG